MYCNDMTLPVQWWPLSPSPCTCASRWCRSTRGPSSSGWADSELEEPRDPASSSSCPALILTRKSISGPSALMFLHKRCGDEHKYEIIKLIKPAIFFQVLSRDSVTVSVDAVVYYRVSNPTMVSIPMLETVY